MNEKTKEIVGFGLIIGALAAVVVPIFYVVSKTEM